MSDSHKPPTHLRYLDSLRGIAAMIVMVYHFINWKFEERVAARIATVVFNGNDAVSFFFVLSGFVLSYQYVVLDRTLDLRKFYIRRFFRLWPAFFVTVLLNALNRVKYDISAEKLKEVFIANKTLFWNEALLIRPHLQYFVPGWTLVVELAFSFIVPFMIVIGYKNVRLLVGLLIATLLIGNAVGQWYMFNIHFCLGVLAANLYLQVQSAGFKQTIWYRRRHLLLAAAFVIFSLRGIYNIIPIGFGKAYDYVTAYLGYGFSDYAAVAAFIVILYSVSNRRARALLENRVLLFFGKISYGIYLMHWTFLGDIFGRWEAIVSYFPNSQTAFVVVFILYFIVTTTLAVAVYYFIEIPFIKLGRRLTSKLKPSLAITKETSRMHH